MTAPHTKESANTPARERNVGFHRTNKLDGAGAGNRGSYGILQIKFVQRYIKREN